MSTLLLLYALNTCPGWSAPEWEGVELYCDDRMREPATVIMPRVRNTTAIPVILPRLRPRHRHP